SAGFFHPIDQGGGLGQAEHLDGDAAQQQTRQPAAAVTTDEDQVAGVFFSCLNDAVGNIEVGNDLARGLHACGFGTIKHLLDVLLRLFVGGLFVVFVGDGVGSGHAIEADRCGERLCDVQRDDLGTDFACETHALVGRL